MPLTESVNPASTNALQQKGSASTGNTSSGRVASSRPSSERLPADGDAKVCWIEVKSYPYQPNHQVELLHLQAEADALLIKLQNTERQTHG